MFTCQAHWQSFGEDRERKERLRYRVSGGALPTKAKGKDTEKKWNIYDRKTGVNFLICEKLLQKVRKEKINTF